MSRIIPKEELADIRPWQALDFDGPARRPATVKPAPPPEPAAPPPAVIDMPAEEVVNLPTAEEIERIHEEARQAGYEAGLAEGREAAATEVAEARESEIAHFRMLTANFHQALESMDQALAEDVLDLALEVAAQVLRSTLTIQRDALLPIIRESIQALPLHHGSLSLHLHPDDLEALRPALGELTAQSPLHLAPDSTIAPGGCLLKAGQSEIDATLATRWKRVLEAIGTDPEAWLTP